MSFLATPEYKWKSWQGDNISCHYIGDEELTKQVINILASHTLKSNFTAEIEYLLKGIIDFGAAVIETPDITVAWVDHIRSFPLFYSQAPKALLISPNVRAVKAHAKLDEVDDVAALEFAMSGYVTDKRTLYKNLHALQPGEFLVWKRGDKEPCLKRYHHYIPDLKQRSDWEENKRNLGRILDNLTRKIIDRANGGTIWVPLSAGLDSRILLCKLHEHGYSNIETFTYGPRYNFEEKYAKKIAKTLNVPWRRVVISNKKLRACFVDKQRKEFWNYADGLKAIPCMREYSAIRALHQSGDVEEGAVFLNGQSGDYITGGHIPDKWLKEGISHKTLFFDELINKHYDLWLPLKTKKNLLLIKESISALLPNKLLPIEANINWAKLGEIWEYDGRQVCYVVNGQRVYEFFGYAWEMPLWEKELVDFCQNLPLKQKAGQALYKDYLQNYNYKGLFSEKEPYIWRWPAPMLWVVPIARIIGLFAGKDAKDKFYAHMRYYGHYANQYVFFPWKEHKKTATNARSMVSLHVRHWISENITIFSEEIKNKYLY